MNNFLNKIFKNKQIWQANLLIVIIFIIIIALYAFWNPTIPSRLDVNQWVNQWGVSGPLALILSIILETVIAPIPGPLISITAGVFYGIWPGILYLWIGNIIGSILAFWIARKLGRTIVKKIIKESKIKVYDNFLQHNKFLIWLVYIIPIFPTDTLGYVIGFSAMPFKHFLKVVMIGFIVNLFILTSFGDQLLSATNSLKLVYVLGLMFLLIIAVTTEKIIKQNNK